MYMLLRVYFFFTFEIFFFLYMICLQTSREHVQLAVRGGVKPPERKRAGGKNLFYGSSRDTSRTRARAVSRKCLIYAFF